MSRDSIETERLRGGQQAFAPVEQWDLQRKRSFRTAAEEAPFMIRTLGLGSGIASLAAKEQQRLTLAAIFAQWLLRDCPHSPYRQEAPHPPDHDHRAWVKALLGKIAASDRAAYRSGQIEALGYAGWIKRLAQAFCPREDR
jgi:CRISPR-associated protein (Cas_Cmr5)